MLEAKRPTIRDVAQEAGVSIATVSRVINDFGTVSPDNKRKVSKAIKKLNYFANTTASNLKRNSSNLIGIVIPTVTNEYFMEIIKGIEDFFEDDNYVLYIASSDDNSEKERKIIKKLLENNVEYIVVATTGGNETYFENLLEIGIKIIAVDRRIIQSYRKNFIGEDNYKNARSLAQTIAPEADGTVAVVGGLNNLSVGQKRLLGTTDRLEEYGISYTIYDGKFTELGGEQVLERIIRDYPRGCSIISLNNAMTTGIINKLYTLLDESSRDKYPLASYGAIKFHKLFSRNIKCFVEQKPYEIGKEVAFALNTLNEEKSTEFENIYIQSSIIKEKNNVIS